MNNYFDDSILLKRTHEKETDIRGDYFRDQTAIIHSMPFRRLKHKTQVFFSPKNDHICTRIEHVLHVATIADTICKGLINHGWKLNTELAYAIGLGHDLGHAPFGHAGETALSKCSGTKFMHELNSYRVVEKLANNGDGLNLTFAVKDGIICHNGENFEKELEPERKINNLEQIKNRKIVPNTWEGCIVRFSDKIAYLGRDIEDALLSELITESELPSSIKNLKKESINGFLINTLILDLIEESSKTNKISISDEKYNLLNELKVFNYSYIYGHEKLSDYKVYVEKIIQTIFEYLQDLFCKNGFDYEKYKSEKLKVAKNFGEYMYKMKAVYEKEGNIPNQILIDYISGMTDAYAIDSMKEICIPKAL